jgi:DegV family protein with EDD domain
MNPYLIATDACADLTVEQINHYHIQVIPMNVSFENKEYRYHPTQSTLSIESFYAKMREKVVATTSLVNVGEFLAFFEPLLEQGNDILYIGFSSALSGTFQSACIARDELKEKYPNQTITCVDSLSASMGEGLLVYLAALLKAERKSMKQVANWVVENRSSMVHLFTVDDLGTLHRGGRLSGAQAFLGGLLKVKPILHVNDQGKLVALQKARGRKGALLQMVEGMKERILEPEKQTIFIAHGDAYEEALQLQAMVQEAIKVKNIVIGAVGPIIGAHAGPGVMCLFFLGVDR